MADCSRTNAHYPHGECQGTAPEFPGERVEIVTAPAPATCLGCQLPENHCCCGTL